jgi:CheY-like chemotaxis protein
MSALSADDDRHCAGADVERLTTMAVFKAGKVVADWLTGRDDAVAVPSAHVCRRCRSRAVRALGDAGSNTTWFACAACRHVWSPGTSSPVAARPSSQIVRARVVIVDDDTSMLRALQLALAAYKPVIAQSAAEGLMLVQHCRPELLMTDYLMPTMTGGELIALARERHPSLKVILLSGHGEVLKENPVWTAERHLLKPCGLQQLQRAAMELIGPPTNV